MNASTTSRRSRGSRRRSLAVAAVTAAAVTGQLLVMSPMAQADGDRAGRSPASGVNLLEPPPDHDDPFGDEDSRRDEGRGDNGRRDDLGKGESAHKADPKVVHGLQEFSSDGTFVPPKGVTSVFIQAWGAGGGGGGGGGGGSAPNDGDGGSGGGGGGGGFVWCAIPVKPSKSYTVVLGDGGLHGNGGPGGTGGAGGTAGTSGAAGTSTTLASIQGDILVTATGGGGGGGGGGGTSADGAPGTPGAGGTGSSCRTGGLTRRGLDAYGSIGGGAVDGIVATPPSTVVGGNGGAGGQGYENTGGPGDPGTDGGNGYAVIFW
ncbi:hypothetical protein [Streptomyces sp. NPDC097981]|uniref:hypothetical protein n=1 Tax=Streptomyces sp. NPDC097981 TaxID=3155428 RepID=UPI003327AFB6